MVSGTRQKQSITISITLNYKVVGAAIAIVGAFALGNWAMYMHLAPRLMH